MKKKMSVNSGTVFWSLIAVSLTTVQLVYFLNYNKDLLFISFIPLISLIAFFWGKNLAGTNRVSLYEL
jgi:hypothetical protein